MKKFLHSIWMLSIALLLLESSWSPLCAQTIDIGDFTFDVKNEEPIQPKKKRPVQVQPVIAKENLDTKRQPEIYVDFVREKGWFKGVNKISADVASHRQVNYRLSEMNKEGNWTKIEIVDHQLQPKDGEGLSFFRPIETDIQLWAYEASKLRHIACIDLEYDPSGKMVIRETARDAQGEVVYIGGYKYQMDPQKNEMVISVAYLQADDAALFKMGDARPTTIRYTYKGDSLYTAELIGPSGESLDMAISMLSLLEPIESRKTYDAFYRVTSVAYFQGGVPYVDSTNVHRIRYEYNKIGKVIQEERTSIEGERKYFFEETKTYRTTQRIDGYVRTDSLDSRGNVKWAALLKDGQLVMNTDGYNLQRTTYDYYDAKHPKSFRANTEYLIHNEKGNYIGTRTIYRQWEEFNYADNTYSAQVYDEQGRYVGGFRAGYIPREEAAWWFPSFFQYLYGILSSFDSTCVPLSPSGKVVDAVSLSEANAMIVSVTGERAHRLGLQDNDVILQWDRWHFLHGRDTMPNLYSLWAYTMLTARQSKQIYVVRQVGETFKTVGITLPAGTLEELQFTLLPGKISHEKDSVLRQYESSKAYLEKKIIIAIPKNPYLHKPGIVYAGGAHPKKFYEKQRPNPQHEWSYDDYQAVKRFEYKRTDHITAWLSYDLQRVERLADEKSEYFYLPAKVCTRPERDQLFVPYLAWYETQYQEIEREPIDLPTLKEAKDPDKKNWYSWQYNTPDKLIQCAITEGNEDGYNLWKKWKNESNLSLIPYSGWKEKYIKGAKKVYIIPLDYTNEKQTLEFVEKLSSLTMNDEWLIYEEQKDSDYYILFHYDDDVIGSKEKAEKGIVEKGSKIFIYDRADRFAMYVER